VTNFFKSFDKRVCPTVGTTVIDQDSAMILMKPYESEEVMKIAQFGEKGPYKYTLNGKETVSLSYVVPTYHICSLHKLANDKTLHEEVIMISVGGWLANDLIRGMTHKMGAEKRVKGLLEKYRILSTRWPKEFKIEDYKEEIKKNPQGKMLHNAIFGHE
jgi:hypothetical protein